MNLDAIIRAHAYASPVLFGLPSHRFFTPLPCFWEKLKAVVPDSVQLVDSGCGMGDLIGEAEKVGRILKGIDVGFREGQDRRVQREDAITYDWTPETWPMMCRPSHDGWAYYTMQNARKRGSAVLYVGLPRNYDRDLGRVRSKCYGVVGEEGEKLYVIDPFRKNT